MNKWLALLSLAGGAAALLAVVLVVFWWLARRHERLNGVGPDDGGRIPAPSDIDYLALDSAHHDTNPHM